MKRAPLFAASLIALLAVARVAWAHPLSPASLLIRESGQGGYDVTFRRSRLAADVLTLLVPEGCRQSANKRNLELDQVVDASTWQCAPSLEGHTIRVLGLSELSIGCVVYLERRDHQSVRALLTAEQSKLVVPRKSSSWRVLADYVRLGIEHLLTGLDHVLFVVGLLWLVRGARRLVLTLTAFTLGHSITLCASALSLVSLPQAPVEVGIALSLVVLALELVESASVRRSPLLERLLRAPWAMALCFGLLHGFGFAGALAQTGLPEHAVPLSLFGFNLGVELGQLAIVAIALPLSAWQRKLSGSALPRVRVVCGYGIGSLAAMWCIERALACVW